MKALNVRNFSLKHTLESGQAFRIHPKDGYYYFTVGNKVLKLKQDGNELYYDCNKGINDVFIRNLFSLDEDYCSITGTLGSDPFIADAIKNTYGIRIINQDPWECLVSYICSSNSSVMGVKRSVDRISKMFGKRILFDGMEFHSFPERLGNMGELKSCGLGFRARHLSETASQVNREKLILLKQQPYAEAKSQLIKLKGVGPKISDCILLYSLGFRQAFPVDRWIKRIVQHAYFRGKSIPDSKIREFASSRFGDHAGYAQLFLYAARKKFITLQ